MRARPRRDLGLRHVRTVPLRRAPAGPAVRASAAAPAAVAGAILRARARMPCRVVGRPTVLDDLRRDVLVGQRRRLRQRDSPTRYEDNMLRRFALFIALSPPAPRGRA